MASTSAKTGSQTNPFDAITEMEKTESARVQTEKEGMHREKEQTVQSLEQKMSQAETEMRDEARKELKEYKEEDLATILKKAENDASQGKKKLEARCESNTDAAIAHLVKHMTNSDSPLLNS